jgi:thiol:disulfide interchange protein
MRLGLLCALLGVLGTTGCKKTTLAPPTVWYDLQHGEEVARASRRPVVLFFHAEWSVADKMLEDDAFTAYAVRDAMRDAVAIQVDMTDDEAPEAMRASQRFGVQGVPTIIVLDGFTGGPHGRTGRELLRFSSFVEPAALAAAFRSVLR